VHLMGGLGNQMFQYAFGRRLSMANGASLVIDASGYRFAGTPDPRTGVRTCGLSNYPVSGVIVSEPVPSVRGTSAASRRLRKISRGVRTLIERSKPYFDRTAVIEPAEMRFRFDPRVLARSFRGEIEVRGFWQTAQYFEDIADTIRTELSLKDAPRGENASVAESIRTSTSAAIHVRHGDNASTIAAKLGVLPRRYYEQAVEALRKEIQRARFFIFSDDWQWARTLLGEEPGFTYVHHNAIDEAHEDLRLMSLCQHHILANSTFGWWGAWLGKKEGQIVYAPRRYYQDADVPNPDLYPSEWRLV